MTKDELKEAVAMYPDGRYLYYEGDDPKGFLDDMEKLGVEFTLTVDVPQDKLAEVYFSGKYVLGS